MSGPTETGFWPVFLCANEKGQTRYPMNVQETVSKNLPVMLGVGALALAGYWAAATAAEAVEAHNDDVSAHYEQQQEVQAVEADVLVIKEQLSRIAEDQADAKSERKEILEKLDALIARR